MSLHGRFCATVRSWFGPPGPDARAAVPVETLEGRRLLAADVPTAAPDAAAPPPVEMPARPDNSGGGVIDGAADLSPLAGGVTGPLSIDGFRPDGRGGLLADGTVSLPGGQDVGFTTDASVSLNGGSNESVTILDVSLGPVDLDLLGLRVDLQRVALRVTATAGEGQVLGNLLTELILSDPTAAADAVSGPLNRALGSAFAGGDGVMGALPIESSLADFDEGIDYDALVGGSSLLGRTSPFSDAPVGGDQSFIAASPAPADIGGEVTGGRQIELPDEVRVLSLEIDKLDLYVLGLRVETLAPVDLSVTAQAGPGRLLGNLFVGISSLLDPLLPSDTGGGTVGPASAPPSSFELMEDGVVPVIALELSGVNLNLLGLEADLNVDLLVGLETGRGDLLGKLLLSQLEQIEQEVRSADFSPLDQLLGFLLNGNGTIGGGLGNPAGGTVGQALAAEGATTGGATIPAGLFSDELIGGGDGLIALQQQAPRQPGNPEPVSILDLRIDELDLDLLGVLIRSQGIGLELRADPGPGALLGNLLGRLLGGFESPTGGGGGAMTRDARSRIEAESFDGTADVVRDPGGFVSFFNDGDALTYEDVDFGSTPVESFTATLAVPETRPGQAFDVRLDSATGPTIGRVEPRGTGGWTRFEPQTVAVTPTSGVRDVVLVGDSPTPGRGIANLDAITFARGGSPRFASLFDDGEGESPGLAA